jgi:hypothetical protein
MSTKDSNTLGVHRAFCQRHRDCVKSPLRCHPRAPKASLGEKRGSIPFEHGLDSHRVESSTHFRGTDKTGGIGSYTVSITLRER